MKRKGGKRDEKTGSEPVREKHDLYMHTNKQYTLLHVNSTTCKQ